LTQAESQRTAGIVSRGVAAIIDLVFVAAVMGLLYLGPSAVYCSPSVCSG
jgi:hypothetical protein